MNAKQKNEDKSIIKSVIRSSAKMASATFLSRILGLIRDQIMAKMFGASGLTDAFLVAYRIPNLLRDLFAEGAFSSSFVPIFTEVKKKNEEDAKRLLWSMFILLGVITLCLSILIIIFAPTLVNLFAPKFYLVSSKFNTTVILVRIMAPFLIFISLAALFMGVLNSLKIFFIPALAPAFFNIVMILSMIFVTPILIDRGLNTILSLGIGVVIGGFVQLLIQLPMIFLRNYGPIGPIKLFSKYTKKIINRLGIGTIGIAANHINILITTIIATTTIVGAVSWLNYAFRLFQFPIGILSVSIAGSNLVHFSDAWKDGDFERSKKFLNSSYLISFVVIIPAMILLLAMSKQTVNLIFERGAFSREHTLMTALALKYYILGLPFYGLFKVFVPTFYVFDKPQIPVAISIVSIIFNIIFCLTMTPVYGFHMLALGTSLSMLLNSSLQAVYLSNHIKLGFKFFINLKILKIIIAGICAYFITSYFINEHYLMDDPFMVKGMWYLISAIAGTFSYVFIMVMMGELNTLKSLMTK